MLEPSDQLLGVVRPIAVTGWLSSIEFVAKKRWFRPTLSSTDNTLQSTDAVRATLWGSFLDAGKTNNRQFFACAQMDCIILRWRHLMMSGIMAWVSMLSGREKACMSGINPTKLKETNCTHHFLPDFPAEG